MLKRLNIKRSEWRLVGGVSLFFIALAGVFLWYGAAHTPDGSVFIATQSINTGDTAVYYSWIEQVRDGHWLQWNLYTPEEHPRFLLDIFWLAAGWMTTILSISAIAGYHLARILLIPGVAIVLYMVVAYFFREEKNRRFAFLLTVFGSGIGGWYQVAVGHQLIPSLSGFPPMDLWVSEGYSFLTLYHSPHFMFSLILMLLTILFFLHGYDEKKYSYTLAAGITGLALFEFHPYHAPTIFAILIAYGLVKMYADKNIPWDFVRRGFVLGLFTLPAVAYHLWTLQEFYIRQQHAAQNATTTPELSITLISYGFLLLFALIGFWFIWKKKDRSDTEIFLAVWFIVHLFLIYAPVNFQRRLSEGLQVVMAMLAAYGIMALRQKYQSKPWWKYVRVGPEMTIPLFIIFFGFTNVFFLAKEYEFISADGPYIAESKMEAFEWIRANTPEGSVIFASSGNGNLQPAFGVRHSYIAHWGMTADYVTKQGDVNWFYSQVPTQEARVEFLQMRDVDFVYYGIEEYARAQVSPDQMGMPVVFQNETGYIFQVPSVEEES